MRLRPSSPRSSAKSDSQRMPPPLPFVRGAGVKLAHRRAANVGAAADVALNQAFGFEFGVGVCDGGPVNPELRGQLAAGGDAVTVAQFAAMDESAELVAQLDVERDVAFGL